MFWGEKPFHSLDYDMKREYGEKLYKITLNSGLSCPNRDGKIAYGGCIFCSEKGSGDFAADKALPIEEQLEKSKAILSKKRGVQSFIAYFQAFTNTYGTKNYLRKIYLQAAADRDVKVISIATRPDCLDDDILDLLTEIKAIKPLWIELGLQSIHPETAHFIRRGYETNIFTQAVQKLKERNIPVIAHIILYLPEESKKMMLETIDFLNQSNISGIKISLLHVLKSTDLGTLYEEKPFPLPTKEKYIAFLATCVAHLRPDITIHRLTGDGPADLLIAPLWTKSKRSVLNGFHQYLIANNIWQGKYYKEKG